MTLSQIGSTTENDSTYRQRNHLRRYRQIATVLAQHGMGYMVGLLGLQRFVPFHWGLLGHPRRARPYARPEHMRMALEELGTTFIKLGQILSTRADLFPPEYLRELAKLQDSLPPVPLDDLKEVIMAELGRPIEAVFATFDPNPLATGSIGQVHAATLPDGTEVVVKVRRPGVVEQVEEDLEILQNLAAAAVRRWEFAERYDIVELAREFAATLRSELDYLAEGRNADHFGQFFRNDPGIHIPKVFWEVTTSRVITLEYIKGIKVSDLTALDTAGVDRKELAQRACETLLRMIFESGVFHADPHPGNVFIEGNGRIGLIDFGMVGVIDESTQGQLADMIQAVASEDIEQLVDALLHIGIVPSVESLEPLQRDLRRLLSTYYKRALGDIPLGQLLNDILSVARGYHLQLPASIFLLLKTLIMSEGVGVQLDPQYNLATALEPYAKKMLLRRYSPAYLGKRLGQISRDVLWLGSELPPLLRGIVRAAAGGNLAFRMQPVEIASPSMKGLERLVNRLVLGIILAAMLNGLAVLMLVYHPFDFQRWMAGMFTFGFVIAVVLSVYLVWSMLHQKR